jgi:hypothetical protein
VGAQRRLGLKEQGREASADVLAAVITAGGRADIARVLVERAALSVSIPADRIIGRYGGGMRRLNRRFRWAALRGRCRRRLAAGLLLLLLAAGHALWAGRHLSMRGSDDSAFDRYFVSAAREITAVPGPVRDLTPASNRELYLKAVITDQQDLAFGVTLFMLRMIVTLTVGGLGMVLLTAGSIEWEIRSEG